MCVASATGMRVSVWLAKPGKRSWYSIGVRSHTPDSKVAWLALSASSRLPRTPSVPLARANRLSSCAKPAGSVPWRTSSHGSPAA